MCGVHIYFVIRHLPKPDDMATKLKVKHITKVNYECVRKQRGFRYHINRLTSYFYLLCLFCMRIRRVQLLPSFRYLNIVNTL